MSAYLLTSSGEINLGNPFTLLSTFSDLEKIVGDEYESYAELFGVPDATMDDVQVDDEWMATVKQQVKVLASKYKDAIPAQAAATLADIVGLRSESRKREDSRGSLIKKTITNKQGKKQTVYVRPDQGKSGDYVKHPTEIDPPTADTLDLSGVSDDPGVVAKIKDKASKVLTRLARLAYDAALASPNVIAAAGMLIDTPDDLKKLGYNPATAGSDSQRVADPLKDSGIPLTTYQAVNLVTTVLPAAIAWVKGKIKGGQSESDDLEALAELLHQMFAAIAEEFGLTAPPDAATIANNLRSL